ncbi:uncharacterized protein TRIREDRAFT_105844 [Trichoderma reesei QM6a]|uniref:Predicted protein n=2 Tax=Hypocrea jecorina TaxID=51453 RepID=G0RG49_HYPJQ|nr:uncharacterized protein TRIREDRAFT_105844 [Trichoderma reesei QM6a]EGR49900.1 predicted protein [Trichoderma reesei QM6a]ETS03223.1 hypothetical protein M419DRAFT_75215 [Trichoderma reesei RUT C-30]
MYINKLTAAGLALASVTMTGDTVAKGRVLDFAVEKCLDSDGNVRCSKPFPVKEGGCYKLEWSTKGALSHTTIEVKDAGSGEMVYYRDTDGKWKPKKNELVYLDFKPKIWGQGNETVDYEVTRCDDDNEL